MQTLPIVRTYSTLVVDVMKHKEIDHNATHLTLGNQCCHFTSSLMIIYLYIIVFVTDADYVALVFLFAQAIRQSGHIFIERNAPQLEASKIGYHTNEKKASI